MEIKGVYVMFRYFVVSFVLVVVTLSTSSALANEIANCGASTGYAYFPKIGLAAASPSAGEWTDDKISNGRITLTLSDTKELDILILDVSGGIFSSRGDGAKIVLLGKTKNALSVFVAYPDKSSETYTFIRNIDGKAEVMWTQNKFATTIPKVASFTAQCSYLAF